MSSESGPKQFATEPRVSSDILARILARRGNDPTSYRRLADDLLDRFGSVEALARVGTDSLLAIPSLSAQDVAVLEAVRDLVATLGRSEEEGSPVIDSFQALGDYVRRHVHRPSVGAQLRAIMLDRDHRVVGDVALEPGLGPFRTARNVIMAVLEHRASGVLLMRVQANTRADMSEEFTATVRRIGDALDRVNVPLLAVALATPAGMVRLSERSKHGDAAAETSARPPRDVRTSDLWPGGSQRRTPPSDLDEQP